LDLSRQWKYRAISRKWIAHLILVKLVSSIANYEAVLIAADVDGHPKLVEHCRLRGQGKIGSVNIRSVCDLDVIGFVSAHHLGLRDPV
jgi:hypothetical protein